MAKTTKLTIANERLENAIKNLRKARNQMPLNESEMYNEFAGFTYAAKTSAKINAIAKKLEDKAKEPLEKATEKQIKCIQDIRKNSEYISSWKESIINSLNKYQASDIIDLLIRISNFDNAHKFKRGVFTFNHMYEDLENYDEDLRILSELEQRFDQFYNK